jgi:hypothetical protein
VNRPFLRSRGLVVGLVVIVIAAAAFVLGRLSAPSASPSPDASATSSPSDPPLTRVGGITMVDPGMTLDDLEPGGLPYPYVEPVPPEEPTPVDGAYLRVQPLRGLGPAEVALPMRCLRCIPFRVETGISTLILYRGRYFLNHQSSGFKTLGFYLVKGGRITFYDDPSCPESRGVYRWQRTDARLRLEVLRDPCPFDRLRAIDLTSMVWTSFNHCVSRLEGLWPGELGCRNRAYQP